MRALSLRQPWAWLVLHGGKRVENRRWPTRVRGEFWVHAAKGMTIAEYQCASKIALAVGLPPGAGFPRFEDLERGGLVGRARIVGMIPPCGPENGPCICGHLWHFPGQHGFLLEDVAPVPFRPLAGALGFFEVPDGPPEPPRQGRLAL